MILALKRAALSPVVLRSALDQRWIDAHGRESRAAIGAHLVKETTSSSDQAAGRLARAVPGRRSTC